MNLTPDEVHALRHRPLFNLLSQIILSVGQPMPRYYLQCSDGTMMNAMEYLQEADGSMTYVKDAGSGCAVYVSRLLASMGTGGNGRLIDGPHGVVASTIRALVAAGWQEVGGEELPKPGDIIIWEKQRQVDGEHGHIGFSLGNGEAVSTNYLTMLVGRHPDDRNAYNEPRKIEQLFRYPWSAEDYEALAHLNIADGSAV